MVLLLKHPTSLLDLSVRNGIAAVSRSYFVSRAGEGGALSSMGLLFKDSSR